MLNEWLINQEMAGPWVQYLEQETFKEKILEIGPVFDDTTKAGKVFILESPYQSSENVFVFYCYLTN